MLKLKFQRLHTTLVRSVNAANIIDFLFQEGVVGEEDLHTLQTQADSRQQCRSLLSLLHLSENRQAFVQLYRAISQESHLQWLLDRIDQWTDPLLNSQVQVTCINQPTGNNCGATHCVCCIKIIYLLGT